MVASPGVWSTIAGHFGTANFSNCCRHGQLLFDLHSREEDDFELKRPRDEARFFGLLKKADGPVTIFFFQDGDDRPQFNFHKTPDTILVVEHAFRVDDTLASARAECVDAIFMVSFHFLPLSSSQRELRPILAPS